MAIQTPPNGTILQNASIDAQVLRQAFAAITTTTGITSAGMFAVSALSTPNMSVNVAAGTAWVPGTQVSNVSGFAFNLQGVYWVLNDATVNLAISAADPTNPRIDLVVLQVIDSQYGGASDTAQLAVITGTPAASPVAPAAPSNSITLAQVAVAANATSIASGNITDRRTYYTPPPVGGETVVTYTSGSTGTTLATVTLTFPANYFANPPAVLCKMRGSYLAADMDAIVMSVSATSASVNVYATAAIASGGTLNMSWIAAARN